LCAGHHRHYSDYPIAWAELIRKRFPDSWEFVCANRNTLYKPDYKAIKAGLEAL
jgi:hypothetical protein